MLPLGGEISIDIYAKGKNKSQVLECMSGTTVFFGDRCCEGGNDYEIATKCDRYFNVGGWEDTYRILNYGQPL